MQTSTRSRVGLWIVRLGALLLAAMTAQSFIDWAVPYEFLALIAKVCTVFALVFTFQHHWDQVDTGLKVSNEQ